MHFFFTRFPARFEIPDDWLKEAGVTEFAPATNAYHSTAAETVVPIDDIEPAFRLRRNPLDFSGFNRERMVRIMEGIASESDIPPIDLLILPPVHDRSAQPFKYRLLDGFHRYYASLVYGFEFIPVTTRSVSN